MFQQQDMHHYGDITGVTMTTRIASFLTQSVTQLWISDICYQLLSFIKIGRADVSSAMFRDNHINITLC
jgi:hypothetical protein